MADKDIKININKAGKFIANYRSSKAWSQAQIADKLGVTRVTVARWEAGEAKPSTLAIKQLEELIRQDPTVVENVSFNSATKKNGRDASFHYYKAERNITPSPYVINGPKDQNSFHAKLIEMQRVPGNSIEWDIYKTRLSLVQQADGDQTAQYLLESPKHSAKSWNSNYGPHGWHRYVGRFPPHLVRALINYFQATPKDTICDPFMGSGTTLVESRLLGIPSIGIEVCSLSCLISRTKTTFPENTNTLYQIIKDLDNFYTQKFNDFIKQNGSNFKHNKVLERKGNNIKEFANIEKWFTSKALLGVSLITEFATKYEGYEQDIILTALSAKMRSIGNVDVDVIRAEYSKKPREKVDVLKLVKNQLLKMIGDIEKSIESHKKTISSKKTISIKEKSVLEVSIPKGSISHIITSPPYGVESLSYLRTHLLSYRTLGYFLKTDPYEFGKKVIGSEYLSKNIPDVSSLSVSKISRTYRNFFAKITNSDKPKNYQIRVAMMMNFFQDMENLADKFAYWLKPGGNIAFVIGNKKIENEIIPTDSIIAEIFKAKGFELIGVLGHKLKTNNSNSKVPWQDRIIDQEFTMIFKKIV